MTAAAQTRVPGQTAGHSALRRLVADPDAFRRDVWSREALLTRAGELPEGFTDLFSESALDELVSRRGLRTPFIRVARDGTTLPNHAFTSGGGVGAGIADQVDDAKLSALFAGGATIVLQALHRTWSPVLDFSQQLAHELAHPLQVNAYVTPPQSRGFDDHYDVHDVFVLQVSGRKHWRIHAPVVDAPLRDQPWTAHRAAVEQAAAEPPVIDAVLEPGDCLYLPRGFIHAATALGDVSTHLTMGIHPWTRHHLARELLDAALDELAGDPGIRTSFGAGVEVDDPFAIVGDVETVRERLAAAVRSVPADEIARRLGDRRRSATRPAPVGPVAQLRASQAPDAD
ncbi:cupin domain-containing protein [Aeromicrobium terrae]|uniref:cupin domain-containing protein n=1 Tax=Aeromicrobium terrae TaxID=2498846 RepID=UPI001C9D470B|nr:cupin domain-containing protein [Aeromicrobium terrae]